MDRIEKLNPNFSRENTEAAFLLLMARFYTMAADGRTQEAVPFARAHLSPLVKNDPDRTEQMKVSCHVLFSAVMHHNISIPGRKDALGAHLPPLGAYHLITGETCELDAFSLERWISIQSAVLCSVFS